MWSDNDNLKETTGYDIHSLIHYETEKIMQKYAGMAVTEELLIRINQDIEQLVKTYGVELNVSIEPNLDF